MYPSQIAEILDVTAIPGATVWGRGSRWTGAFDTYADMIAFIELCEEANEGVEIVSSSNYGRFTAQWVEPDLKGV